MPCNLFDPCLLNRDEADSDFGQNRSLKMGWRIGKNFGQNDRINKMGHGFFNPFDVHFVILSKIRVATLMPTMLAGSSRPQTDV